MMGVRARAVVVLLACSVASLLAVVLAALPARAADEAAAQAARQHFQEGVTHYAEKRFAKARLSFIQAYALERQPAVLLKLAESELRSGHASDAAAHFAAYLNENAQAGPAERRDAQKGLAAAKAKVGEVVMKIDAAGAVIFVDGEPGGSAPLPGSLYLEPGSHKIEAHKDGKVAAIEVQAQAGMVTTANLNLAQGGSEAAPAAAAAPAAGSEGLAAGAQAPPGADSGPSDSRPGREPFFKWFGRRKLAWVGVGLTAIGVTGGIVFAVRASNSYDRADQVAEEIRVNAAQDNISGPCFAPERHPRADQYVEACGKLSSNMDDGDTQRTVSIVSFVVAGAAAAGTVAYYIVDSKPRKETSVKVRLAPIVTTSFNGLHLSGEF